MREREEQRIIKKYRLKVNEEQVLIRVQYEDMQDKKLSYYKELRFNMNSRLENEKQRLNLEKNDQLREIKI